MACDPAADYAIAKARSAGVRKPESSAREFAPAPLCPVTGAPCPHPAACGLAAGLATYCPR